MLSAHFGHSAAATLLARACFQSSPSVLDVNWVHFLLRLPCSESRAACMAFIVPSLSTDWRYALASRACQTSGYSDVIEWLSGHGFLNKAVLDRPQKPFSSQLLEYAIFSDDPATVRAVLAARSCAGCESEP